MNQCAEPAAHRHEPQRTLQQARRVLDRLVGFVGASPVLWRKIQPALSWSCAVRGLEACVERKRRPWRSRTRPSTRSRHSSIRPDSGGGQGQGRPRHKVQDNRRGRGNSSRTPQILDYLQGRRDHPANAAFDVGFPTRNWLTGRALKFHVASITDTRCCHTRLKAAP